MSIRCTSCGQEKPDSAFYARTDRPGFLLSGCKDCRAAWAKERRQEANCKLAALTPADVQRVYSFDAKTGFFTCLKSGKPAGNDNGHGYLMLGLEGIQVLAHRVAWLMYHGEWPPYQVDHQDHDRRNNRRENLTLAPEGANARNMSLSSRNKSGVVGVSWYAARGRWVAQIGVKQPGRSHNKVLGHFNLLEDAIAARRKAEAELGYHQNHGAMKPKQEGQAHV